MTRGQKAVQLAWVLSFGAVCCIQAASHAATPHGKDLLHEFNPRVYVAELPPKYNIDTVAQEGCKDVRALELLMSNPLGNLLSESLDAALYRNTSARNLEVHMHMQMLYSPLRVLSEAEADIVYVPLYMGQLLAPMGSRGACAREWSHSAAAALVAEFWAEAPALLPSLGSKPHWAQLAEREVMLRSGCGGVEEGLPLLCHALADKVIWATPEAATAPHPLHGRARFFGPAPSANNTLAVPYLGHVHRLSMQSRAALLAASDVVTDKKLLAAVVHGSGVAEAPGKDLAQAKLAAAIVQACQERAADCAASQSAVFVDAVAMHRRAWFCVTPPGDTPTSIGLADCFAAGLAVPAMFDEYLYDLLPFADVLPYRSMSAHVPLGDAAAPGISFLDHLGVYGLDHRTSMLRAMQNVSQALQYAVRPNHLLVRLDRLATVHTLDDAFTMSFKAVMRRVCGQDMQGCRAKTLSQGVGSI